MLVSKQHRRTVYEALFKEGVLVAKKEFNAPSHFELTDVPNLVVIKLCQSLTSRGYVATSFSWQWYYYTLTNEGIEYLREYLHLPSEIVPATHKKTTRSRPGGQSRPQGEGAYRAPRPGQDEYRRKDDGENKETAAGDFRPRYAGVGRGAPAS